MVGPETESTPDNASVHVKLTVTGTLFQPCVLASGDLEDAMIGVVKSTLIPMSITVTELPARSAHIPRAA